MKRITVCLLLILGLTLAACEPKLSVEEASALLLEATKNNDLAGVTRALEQGADIETAEPIGGLTPLIIASNNGFTEIATHLIDAGADVNRADRNGFTPLMGAAQFGHATLIPILVEAGADLEALTITENQKAALHFAAKNGHAAVVEALLNAGADVNALVKSTHSTALMNAAYQGHMDVVKILLEHGADTTVLDDSGHTASYWADTRGFKEIAQLIEKTK